MSCFCLQCTNIPIPTKTILGYLQAIICFIAAYIYISKAFIVILITCLVKSTLFIHNLYYSHDVFIFAALQLEILILIASSMITYLRCQHTKEIKAEKYFNNIDELTQTFNRHFFRQKLNEEIYNADINHSNVGLIFIDVDNFKSINDTFGHDYGDSILISISNLLKDISQPEYSICRYGGDEFAIIIPNIETDSLESFSKNFRGLLTKNYADYIHYPLNESATLSMGLSVYPYMAHDFETLLQQADMALYHAKNSGRDQLHIYQDLLAQLEDDITLENKHLISIFKALLTCLSTKDTYSLGHSKRVASYASDLARFLGLSISEINTLYYAGLLHDIGKIEIPMTILNKTDELTEEEYNIIKMHPVYSANILEPLSDMYQLVEYVRHHHERFDGQGYPDHLSGSDISFGARILAVVDAYDAMLSERPYRESLDIDATLAEISRHSGSQFDPYIANAFIEMINLKTASSSSN